MSSNTAQLSSESRGAGMRGGAAGGVWRGSLRKMEQTVGAMKEQPGIKLLGGNYLFLVLAAGAVLQ